MDVLATIQITFPLERFINRCKAQMFNDEHLCPEREDCARYISMAHDVEPVPYKSCACSNEQFLVKIPVNGWSGLMD